MKHCLAFGLPVHKFWRSFVCILMWIILIGAVVVPQSLYAQFDPPRNHYKTWRIQPIMGSGLAVEVKDQFMTDFLQVLRIDYLSNPVVKDDTFRIIKPDNHLTWYRVSGRDTLINLEYVNQFEASAKVEIDSVHYLLVPTWKQLPGHNPPESLDHYKAYRIRNPYLLNRSVKLLDQFDERIGTPEFITSLKPVYFLTPAQKKRGPVPEPVFDTITHYVAYEIQPPRTFGFSVPTQDQFGSYTMFVDMSQLLLVPTKKILITPSQEACCFPDGSCGLVPVGTCPGVVVPACLGDLNGNGIDDACEPPPQEACCFPDGSCGLVPVGTCPGVVVPACLGDLNGNGIDDACEQPPTPVDTLRNHFKTWRILTQPVDIFALVQDQFMQSEVKLDTIDFLSNPVRKIVFVPPVYDTSDIRRPNDHLTWYRAKSLAPTKRFKVKYVNQFESTSLVMDTLRYLLLPTRKDPHPEPDSLLGHYTAYRVKNPKGFRKPVQLQDQFDQVPELIDSLVPAYFLAPAQKNNEPRYEPDTHYVAYEIFPKRVTPQTRTTLDQFGPHSMQIRQSELLLLPTNKVSVKYFKAGDANGDGSLSVSDVVYLINYLFKGGPPADPIEAGDANCDGLVTIADVIYLVNYLFKGGPPPR